MGLVVYMLFPCDKGSGSSLRASSSYQEDSPVESICPLLPGQVEFCVDSLLVFEVALGPGPPITGSAAFLYICYSAVLLSHPPSGLPPLRPSPLISTRAYCTMLLFDYDWSPIERACLCRLMCSPCAVRPSAGLCASTWIPLPHQICDGES